MEETKRLFYLEQLTNLTLDYTYLLEIDEHDRIVPEMLAGSFEKITGYSLSELKEKNFFLSIIYEEDLSNFLEYWGKIISGKTEAILTRILTKKNEVKWIKNYSKPIIDESSGRVLRILGAIQDITEEKLMEEILKEAERYYKTIIEYMGEGLVIADNNDHIIYVNSRLIEMLEYEKREIIGKVGYNILVPETDKNLIMQKNALRQKGVADTYESSFITKNRHKVDVSITGSPLVNEKGAVVGSIGIVNDVSESKVYIEQLKKKSKEIATLYEAGKSLSESLDINSIFEVVFRVVSEVIDCSELFVARYDEYDKMIRYIFLISNLGGEPINVTNIPPIPLAPPGYGILSEVIRKSKSVILNDYQQSLKKAKVKYNIVNSGEVEDISETPDNHVEPIAGPRSALIVPIRFENTVLGVVQFYSEKKNAFDEVQLHFVETLIQQAALSYRNATLYQKAQEEIRERTSAEKMLVKALEERELLIKEIFHRVKNNMQVISSLISIQSEKIQDKDIKSIFIETRNRVNAISLIHEKLYRAGDLSRIDFSDYISVLMNNLKHIYTHTGTIDVVYNNQKLFLPIDIAVPCGIIINELVTNSFKHAFDVNGHEAKKIEVKFGMNETQDKYYISVKDNGKGFPENMDIAANENTLGLRLLKTLASQIEGKLECHNHNGTEIKITFPPSRYKERI